MHGREGELWGGSLGPRPHSPSPKKPVRLQDRVTGVPQLSLPSVIGTTCASYHQNSGTPRDCNTRLCTVAVQQRSSPATPERRLP